MKKLPGGWLVYAVGSDLEDDGGKVDDPLDDVGIGPLPPPDKEP